MCVFTLALVLFSLPRLNHSFIPCLIFILPFSPYLSLSSCFPLFYHFLHSFPSPTSFVFFSYLYIFCCPTFVTFSYIPSSPFMQRSSVPILLFNIHLLSFNCSYYSFPSSPSSSNTLTPPLSLSLHCFPFLKLSFLLPLTYLLLSTESSSRFLFFPSLHTPIIPSLNPFTLSC